MNKKLLGVLGVAALLLAGNFAWQEVKEVDAADGQPETLYLKPNSNWTQSNARFAAYFFGNGDTWVSMVDSDSDGVHEVTVPTDKKYPNVIFVRMNPSTTENNWNNGVKWNQTSDLTIPTNGNNLYTVKEDTWDKGGGTWSTFNVVQKDYEVLDQLVNTYYNEGHYVRATQIYVDQAKIAADLLENHPTKEYANLFHAKATSLTRTTYFEGDQLWMKEANSGYGTDGELMTHFKYENDVKKVDYTVDKSHANWATPSENGMEGFYTTLKDIKPTESQAWTKSGNIYKSSDASLKKAFQAFTAPCFVGFDDVPNYITFDHVEVEETEDGLELRLYTVSGDSGKLNSSSTNNLFSKAVISHHSVYLPGNFNGDSEWTEKRMFTITNAGYSYTMELDVGEYEFKVRINDGEWLGNSGNVNGDEGCLDWEFKSSVSDNCKITVKTAGTYKFTFNDSNKKLSIQKIA